MLCSSLPKWIILSMAAWLPPHSCRLFWADSTSAAVGHARERDTLLTPLTDDGVTTSREGLETPTHVGLAVLGLSGVFGAAVEETIGGGLRHSVGEVVDFHVHVTTEEDADGGTGWVGRSGTSTD